MITMIHISIAAVCFFGALLYKVLKPGSATNAIIEKVVESIIKEEVGVDVNLDQIEKMVDEIESK